MNLSPLHCGCSSIWNYVSESWCFKLHQVFRLEGCGVSAPWQPRASGCLRGGEAIKKEQSRGCRLKVLSCTNGAPEGETASPDISPPKADQRGEKWAERGGGGGHRFTWKPRNGRLHRRWSAAAHSASDLTHASFLKDGGTFWESSRRNLVRLKFQVRRAVGDVALGPVYRRPGIWQSAAGAVHDGGAGLVAQTHQLYSCLQKDGCNCIAL